MQDFNEGGFQDDNPFSNTQYCNGAMLLAWPFNKAAPHESIWDTHYEVSLSIGLLQFSRVFHPASPIF